jgi:tRNA threonylcarbamoyladenosine biosynthesis protein TsaB
MDARRGQTYTGIYEFVDADGGMQMHTLEPQCAVDIHEILTRVGEFGRPVIFSGDGVPVFSDTIAECLQVPYTFAPAHLNKQRAGALAALAAIYMKQGKTVSAGDHQPDYLRLSQAERERQEKAKRLPGDLGT